jgi:tRNA(Arg) A34 adenosine deaminase TadA
MQAQYNKFRHFNKTKSGIKHSVHAEIAAINSISYVMGRDIDWTKVKLYIYRICPGHESGQGLSKSCPACQAAIQDLGIKHVYYTTDDGFAYEEFL